MLLQVASYSEGSPCQHQFAEELHSPGPDRGSEDTYNRPNLRSRSLSASITAGTDVWPP